MRWMKSGRLEMGAGSREVVLASVLLNLFGLALPIALLQIYDRVLPNLGFATLGALLGLLSIFLVAESLIRFMRDAILIRLRASGQHKLHMEAMESLLRTDLSATSPPRGADIAQRFRALQSMSEARTTEAAATIVDCGFLLLFLAVLAAVGGWLVLAPIAFLAGLALSVWRSGRDHHAALSDHRDLETRRYQFVAQLLEATTTIKTMAIERPMLRRYERLQEQSAAKIVRLASLSSRSQAYSTLCANGAMIAVVATGSVLVLGQNMSLGALAACTLIAGRIMNPLSRTVAYATQANARQLAERDAAALFSGPKESARDAEAGSRLSGAITIENVVIEGSSPSDFTKLDLNIEAGEMIGLTGANEFAASKLIAALHQRANIVAGRIRFGGLDAAQLAGRSLRRQVGFVPREPELLNGTLFENVTLFREPADLPALENALEILEADETLGRLPLGLATPVGEAVLESLPMGFQQRLSLARAIAGDPAILLFDHGNALMDGVTDKFVHRFLSAERGKRTIIIASYRPSLLALCNRVFEFEHDRVLERRNADAKTNDENSETRPEVVHVR